MPRELRPYPFRLDMRTLLHRFRGIPAAVGASVQIALPNGLSLRVKPDRLEKRVANEIVIRLSDRRVLNAWECCDGCIDKALESIQEIRRFLVDKQVELADRSDSALFLLVEMITEAIRQFLTFEQRLTTAEQPSGHQRRSDGWHRDRETLDRYFSVLEMLRGHIHRTLLQIASIADMTVPNIAEAMRYDSVWDADAYEADDQPE